MAANTHSTVAILNLKPCIIPLDQHPNAKLSTKHPTCIPKHALLGRGVVDVVQPCGKIILDSSSKCRVGGFHPASDKIHSSTSRLGVSRRRCTTDAAAKLLFGSCQTLFGSCQTLVWQLPILVHAESPPGHWAITRGSLVTLRAGRPTWPLGDHWGITGNFEGREAHLATGGSLGDHW